MPKRDKIADDSNFISRNRNVVLFVSIVVASLATIIIFRTSYISNPSLLSLLQKGLVTFADTVSDTGLIRERIEEVDREYEQLLRNTDIYAYSIQFAGYEELNAQRIADAIAFSSTAKFESVIAQIIARDPSQIFHTFTIDKGRKHGIAVDMPVIALQDGRSGLVGKVVRVAGSSAMIESIIDERSFVTVEHLKSQLAGIMQGAAFNNQILTLDLIDAREIELVRPGDLVVTSRFSSVYPPSIPIGTIQPFQQKRGSDQAMIDILPILNFNRLNYVFILLPREIFFESAQ